MTKIFVIFIILSGCSNTSFTVKEPIVSSPYRWRDIRSKGMLGDDLLLSVGSPVGVCNTAECYRKAYKAQYVRNKKTSKDPFDDFSHNDLVLDEAFRSANKASKKKALVFPDDGLADQLLFENIAGQLDLSPLIKP